MSHNYAADHDMTDTMTAIEHYEERAAIIEYDAGTPRINAESMALREVSQRYGTAAAKAVNEWRKAR